MNLHMPQSVEAATELREIAAVPKQMISPRLSKPLISIVQDTLVGVNRLTRPTEFFNLREYMNLLVHSKRWDGRIPPPAKTDPVPMWSGRQVVSALLPAVYLAMGNKMWEKDKGKSDPNYVIINNGELENGIIDGDVFDKALIHILYNDFSPEMTVDFIDSLQAVVAAYLQNSGFSVGMSDLIADQGTLTTISAGMEDLKKKIESLQLQVHMGLFDNSSGRTNQEEFEMKVFNNLDKAIGEAGKMGLKSLAANNRMVNMVKCGSKGSDVNIAQMISLLGQQSIDGKRITYGFQDRTLPHFKRYDDGAEARGFVESSFVKGLNPAEFFFHAMTGREGLIDTAVKSVTGDTPIVVMENGQTKRVSIGDWIDAQLDVAKERVENFEDRDMELLQLNEPVYIPTTDEDGKVTWGEITAITRHDPGKELYEIKTQGGKSVIVTESHSLLIYNAETKKFQRTLSPEVRAGDFVPVTMNLPTPPTASSNNWNISDIVGSNNIPFDFVTASEDVIQEFFQKYAIANVSSSDSGFCMKTTEENSDIINMLCNRVGVFGSVNKEKTEITIGSQWASKFNNILQYSPTTFRSNDFSCQNDVVLDKILEIKKVSIEKYPKVYDLTVPSTLNFGLANGLHVVDTADSGYLQRQLVKTMEDLIVCHDGSVRDAGGVIVQFAYGDDGTSATKIENQSIGLANLGDAEIRAKFSVEDVAPEKSQQYLAAIFNDRDVLVRNVWGGVVDSSVQSAVHLPRLIANTIQELALESGKGTPVTGSHVLETIDSIIQRTRSDNQLWGALLRYHLNPRDLQSRGFTRAAFDWLAEQIVVKHMKSWVVPGEMAGIISAQSLGEPTTQMTLNTFHLSGVAAKSGMTRGVPRLKELLKVSQNPKATSLTIFLRPDIRNSKEQARRLAQELEFTMLKDLVTTSRIYYDPRDDASLIAEDKEWLSFFAAFEQSAAEQPERQSPWILRLELDREKMFNKNITMEDINFIIKKTNNQMDVAYTDHNATQLVFRIRIPTNAKELDDLATIKIWQNKLLTSALVRGLPGLRAVSFRKLVDTEQIYEKNPANDNKYEAVDQFVMDTFGTNFLDVMIHPDVDGTKLISNHIYDIYENLGIEATRQLLFREVFSLFKEAAPVNYRHVALLCDTICSRGRLMSADRFGVNKKKTGPLAKASFEQTGDIMLRAALFGEMDPVTGVSANIMTGQPIRGGTSYSQVLLDEAAFQEFMTTAPPPRKALERAPRLTQDEVDRLIETAGVGVAAGCRQEDLRIPTVLPPMMPLQTVSELPELEINFVDE